MKPIIRMTALSLLICCALAFSSCTSDADSLNAKEYKVMLYGDSITEGYWTPGGYRNILCSLLEENGISAQVDFVGPYRSGTGYDLDHAGFTGYMIATVPTEKCVTHDNRAGLLDNAEQIMKEYAPDIVILQVGTNDIINLADWDNVDTRLQQLVDTIVNNLPDGGILYLTSIPPIDASDDTYISQVLFTPESMNQYVDEYNGIVRNLTESEQRAGNPVHYIDIYSIVGNNDLIDGIHPNRSGYTLIAEKYYEVLQSLLAGNVFDDLVK